METVLKIKGMHCDHCRRVVVDSLSAIPGVRNAEVSLERREAVVVHDGNTGPLEFVKAIEAEGYRVALE